MVESMDKELHDLPEQLKDGFALGGGVELEGSFKNVILAGMGGSGLPSTLLQCLNIVTHQLHVVKGYHLPKEVSKDSLVIIISYSGNTEESVNMYREGKKSGATIVAITSGGKLSELAEKYKDVLITVPGGKVPRLAYGLQFFTLLGLLENAGFTQPIKPDVEKTYNHLKKDIFTARAKDLAETLKDKIPLIYASESLAGAAYKWKINFNETSKTPAFTNVFPELTHNEIMGFTLPLASFHVIILADEEDDPKVLKQMKVAKSIIIKQGASAIEIALTGECRLAKVMSAIYLGDWAAYYLALAYRQDPNETKIIDELKEQLKNNNNNT